MTNEERNFRVRNIEDYLEEGFSVSDDVVAIEIMEDGFVKDVYIATSIRHEDEKDATVITATHFK